MLGQPGLDPAALHGDIQRLHRFIAFAAHGGDLRAERLQPVSPHAGVGHAVDERGELLEAAIRAFRIAGGAQRRGRHE